MELSTPSAVLWAGAADPTAQQSCVPATAPRTKVTKFLSLEIWEESERSVWRFFKASEGFLQVLGSFESSENEDLSFWEGSGRAFAGSTF